MSMAAIRPLAAAETAQAAALHARCFDDPWDAAALAELIAMPGAFALAADAAPDAPLAGLVLARVAAGEAEILTIAVDPSWRRQGLGGRLIEAAAAAALTGGATALFLEVAADNTPARGLYARLGFREVGARPAYYARGGTRVAAHILRLDLAAGASS